MPTKSRAELLLAVVALAGCPDPEVDESTITATSSTTSDGMSGGTDASTTAGVDPTTTGGEGEVGPTRVFFYTRGEDDLLKALRAADLVDGEVSAPVDVLVAAAGAGLANDWNLSPDRRWLAAVATDAAGTRTWLIDTTSLAAKEIVVPGATFVGPPRYSSDSALVAFIAGAKDGALEFYACTLAADGACAAAPFSAPLLPGGTNGGGELAIAPDKSRVLYPADREGDGGLDVMLGRIGDPAASIELASFPATFADIGSAHFASDGSAVYYAVDFEQNYMHQHFVVDLTTDPPGAPTLLHPPPLGESRGRFAFDKSALLWWSGPTLYGDWWRITLDGPTIGAPELVNLHDPGKALGGKHNWAPDSTRVSILSSPDATPATNDLYVVDLTTSPFTPVRVNQTATPGAASESHFSPDSDRIAFFANTSAMGGAELYLARVEAPVDTVKLSGPLPAGAGLTMGFAWAPDGSRVLYSGAQETLDQDELFMVDVAGASPTPPVKINGPLPQGFVARVNFDFEFTPDAQRILYRADRDETSDALYTVAIDPEGLPQPPEEIAPGDDVVSFLITSPP